MKTVRTLALVTSSLLLIPAIATADDDPLMSPEMSEQGTLEDDYMEIDEDDNSMDLDEDTTIEVEPMTEETIIEVDEQPIDLEPEPIDTVLLLEEEPERLGLTLQLGGGVVGFTDSNSKDVGDVGGSWTARVVMGTQWPFAIEAAYIGSAQGINALGLDSDAVLVGNGAEANLRLNLLEAFIDNPIAQPYLGVGAAWRHYSVTNDSFNTSNVADSDDVFEIPLSAGLGFRAGQFMLDVRGTYRRAFDDDLIAPTASGEEFELHSWNAQGTVGFEF